MCKVAPSIFKTMTVVFVSLVLLLGTSWVMSRAADEAASASCAIPFAALTEQAEQARNQGIKIEVAFMRGEEVPIFNEVIKEVSGGEELEKATVEIAFYTITVPGQPAVVKVYELDATKCVIGNGSIPLDAFNSIVIPLLIEKLNAAAKNKI